MENNNTVPNQPQNLENLGQSNTMAVTPDTAINVAPENNIQNTDEAPKPKSSKKLIIILILAIIAIISIVIICVVIGMQRGDKVEQDESSENSNNYQITSPEDLNLVFLKLENEQDKNIIYSPLSIKYALAMLSDAAADESKAQIESLIEGFDLKKYTNNDKQSLANAMFVQEEFKNEINNSYKETLENKYGASVIPDPFTDESVINEWVSQKTFGLINNLLNKETVEGSDFVLVNALAIDMNWKNQLQCFYSEDEDDKVPCLHYGVKFENEKYTDYVTTDYFDTADFNNQQVKVADIGATANKYDIISDLGEEYIRSTVQSAYDEWLVKAQESENYPEKYDISFDIDQYMEELKANYGKLASSTDFYFLDTDTEKVFAKDLQENEDSALQYIGIMPKDEDLSTYIETITPDKITAIMSQLNDVSEIDGFKDGVITKISSNIPFFKFDCRLELKNDLENLGVTDVFSKDNANLSQMTHLPNSYIEDALHKANIDFSNDGIRAAAATALVGGMGAAAPYYFEYEWDVPVEEIDLTFDKPFMFIIYDKNSGEVWFVGSVYNIAD